MPYKNARLCAQRSGSGATGLRGGAAWLCPAGSDSGCGVRPGTWAYGGSGSSGTSRGIVRRLLGWLMVFARGAAVLLHQAHPPLLRRVHPRLAVAQDIDDVAAGPPLLVAHRALPPAPHVVARTSE